MTLIEANRPDATLRTKVRAYKNRVSEIKSYLDKHPNEWGRFQSEFNQEINGIFRDLMLFEKENLFQEDGKKVYKLKRLFIKRFRNDFVIGEYLKWSLGKPYGYAGDFKIVDDIYRNDPKSSSFERLYDNYFQMSAICVAVRNRKEDFKKIVSDFVMERRGRKIKIMDLASGPCRDIHEILCDPKLRNEQFVIHCYENDERAIEYAKRLVGDDPRAQFFKQNAVRIALMKDVKKLLEGPYDLIFSTGLFDYLDYRVSVRLVANLRELLTEKGLLVISDVRDKFSNPSIYFMEWVADWNLIYREDDNFREIFIDAGFSADDLACRYEQQGIMQYVRAERNR